MLYYCKTPLFIVNHIDMHANWRNPGNTSRRKQRIMDVAAIFLDESYKDSVVLTDEQHRQWSVARLSQDHLNYAAKHAYVCFEIFKRLHVYERGFKHPPYVKYDDVSPSWGWGWGPDYPDE